MGKVKLNNGFQVGDWIVVTEETPRVYKGMVGEVVGINSNFNLLCYFGEGFHGHAGGGYSCQQNNLHNWWLIPDYVRKLKAGEIINSVQSEFIGSKPEIRKFQVGDLIKGVSDAPYGYTDADSICRVVKILDYGEIIVELVHHSDYETQIKAKDFDDGQFIVEEEYFELYEN